MRRRHFEALRPVCPACLTRSAQEHPVKIGFEVRSDAENLDEGALHCTNPECQCEFPVLDGIPILVPDVRSYLAANVFHLTLRDDLPDEIDSILGDACGPGSAYDTTRLHLSSYAWDHYAEFDPREAPSEPRPGSVVRVLAAGLELASEVSAGPQLDVGCSVGRTTFELARRGGGPVLGVDLNFSMLRLAARAARTGRVRYPRRRTGVVYDVREFPVPFAGLDVDFWACDAAALPLPVGSAAALASLNTLDSVASPVSVLHSFARVLKPGAPMVLCTPFDWSAAVTPMECWVGGHSKRAQGGGDGPPLLRALLTPGAHSASVAGLHFVAEGGLPWHVRLHDHAVTTYRTHVVLARAAGT